MVTTPTTNIVAQIRALHDRLLKGQILAASGKVHPVVDMPDSYIVEGSKGPYLIKDGKCGCPDATNRNGLINGYCKHVLASILLCQELGPVKPTSNGPSTDNEQENQQGMDHDLEAKIRDLYR